MPYVEVEDLGLKMFYMINPLDQVRFASTHGDPAPESSELDPSKPILLFLHAGAQSCASFVHQFADKRLSAAFNLVGLDARTHGRTEGTPLDELTMEQSAKNIIRVLEVLGYEKFAIFAEGVFGAAHAVWLTLEQPEKVLCLALASPGWIKEPDDIASSLAELSDWCCVNKEGNGDKSGAIPRDCINAVTQYFLGDQIRLEDRRDDVGRAFQIRYGTGQSAHDVRHLCLHGQRATYSAETLAKIQVPVLIFNGTEDTLISPLKACQEWQTSLTGAKGGADLRRIQGAPHLLSYTDYNIVDRMLAAFVTKAISM